MVKISKRRKKYILNAERERERESRLFKVIMKSTPTRKETNYDN
jgi:hypothetical protein